MSWTDERVALLKQLWGEGKTAAEIAKALGNGVTRNAVIGKAHRLKLSNRVSPIQQNNKKPALPEKTESTPRKAAVPVVANNGKGIKLADLKDRMCRWPNGDPRDADFNFCGCPAVPGLPYCPEHAKIAYQTSRPQRVLQAEEFEEKENAEAPDMEIRTAANG